MDIDASGIYVFATATVAVVAGVFALFFWYQDKKEEKAKQQIQKQ